MRSSLSWRFALSLVSLVWNGDSSSDGRGGEQPRWGLRLVLPAWIVHGSFAVLLVVWVLF